MGEGLVNSSCAVMYLDIGWTCGGVAHTFWTGATFPRFPDVNCSVSTSKQQTIGV